MKKIKEAAPAKQKLPKRFSINEGLLEQASTLLAQLPIKTAHKLLKEINDNKIAEKIEAVEEGGEATNKFILPTDMLNDLLGFLTTYPVFISMELITMINMDLTIPDNKVKPKTVELKPTKEKK